MDHQLKTLENNFQSLLKPLHPFSSSIDQLNFLPTISNVLIIHGYVPVVLGFDYQSLLPSFLRIYNHYFYYKLDIGCSRLSPTGKGFYLSL